MATITFGKSGSRPYGTLAVTETGTSVANNTSTVKAVLTLHRPNNVSSSASKSWSMTINGTKYSGSGSIGGSGNKTLLSKTLTVAHNADGTKSINFSASIKLAITWSGTSLGTISGSGSLKLSNIARASQPTCPSSADVNTNITINTNRASSSFTHTVTYSFAGKSGTIATGVGASCTWKPPYDLFSGLGSSTSNGCTITVTTYNGSTNVGSKTCGITLKMPNNGDTRPVVGTPTVSNEHPQTAALGVYVQSVSTLKAAVTYSFKYGASLRSCVLTIGPANYSGANVTIPNVPYSGTIGVKATVTDSRGFTTTGPTVNVNILEYKRPFIEIFKSLRANADGTVDEDYGNCMINTIRYSSEMTGIEGYGITYKTQYMLDDGTWADMGSGGGMEVNTDELITDINFAPDKPYTTRVVLTDMFTTYEARSSISNTFTEINIIENGVGLGALAQPGKLTIKKEWLMELIYPVGSVYISRLSTPPNELFGGGVWKRLEDTYLKAVTDKCATYVDKYREHDTFTIDQPTHVRYGAAYYGDNWRYFYLNPGTYTVDFATFGDPLPGITKTLQFGSGAVTSDAGSKRGTNYIPIRYTQPESTGFGLTKTDSFKDRVCVVWSGAKDQKLQTVGNQIMNDPFYDTFYMWERIG